MIGQRRTNTVIIWRMLCKVDAALISILEWFTHWFQRMTGKTNYFLVALASLVQLGIGCGVLLEGVWHRPSENSFLGQVIGLAQQHYIFALAWLVFTSFRALLGWHAEEAEALDRLSQGLANPQKVHKGRIVLRLFWLLYFGIGVSVLSLFEGYWLLCAFFQLQCLEFYLGACDPLPPCRGWFWDMFRKPAADIA